MNYSRFLFFSVLILLFHFGFAQEEIPTSRRAARGFLSYSNFRHALDEYQKLLAKDSTNVEYLYSIGLCYIETNIDKSKAIFYLEKTIDNPRANSNTWYELGRAYALNYRFQDAINAFKKFIDEVPKDENFIPASRWIEMCTIAIDFVSNPVNVTFQNIGADINSDAPDLNAFVTADETFMVFTTKRAGNVGNWLDYDGFYTSDIMYTNLKHGVWQKPKRLPNSINTAFVEESVSLSPDGTHLFVYLDNYSAAGDVYLSVKSGRSFSRLEPLGANINSRNLETSACISPNRKIIFFAASLPDSFGGMDIYYTSKLPNGEWGLPQNAGNMINTIFDEEFPTLSPDGKSLYFASTGHNSMGGFDIFKSDWDKANMIFSAPVNLGYPINTPDNNFTISFTKSGRYAYTSAFRDDSHGDLDIYRLIFNDVEPPQHLITGHILNTDSVNIFSDFNLIREELIYVNKLLDTLKLQNTKTDSARVESLYPGIFTKLNNLKLQISGQPDIFVTVKDKRSDTTKGIYRPVKQSGKYVIVLPPGDYVFIYDGEGFQKFEAEVLLPDCESYNEETTMNIVLHK